MKKLMIGLMCLFFVLGCSQSKKELFKETDAFVKSLQTTYNSYGIQGMQHAVTTSDGLYTITPIGRLINVKVQKVVKDSEYEKLKKELENHYKKDTRVNKVYINQGGTVMIDCRN